MASLGIRTRASAVGAGRLNHHAIIYCHMENSRQARKIGVLSVTLDPHLSLPLLLPHWFSTKHSHGSPFHFHRGFPHVQQIHTQTLAKNRTHPQQSAHILQPHLSTRWSGQTHLTNSHGAIHESWMVRCSPCTLGFSGEQYAWYWLWEAAHSAPMKVSCLLGNCPDRPPIQLPSASKPTSNRSPHRTGSRKDSSPILNSLATYTSSTVPTSSISLVLQE